MGPGDREFESRPPDQARASGGWGPAQDNPARFAPDLATSLNNLSGRLGDAGAGAPAAIREALEIRRRLAQDNPARFAAALERSLKILESLGQR